MSARATYHPPAGVTLDDWYRGDFDEYALLLQPFHVALPGGFSEEERKRAPAISWEQAAEDMGVGRLDLARMVHTLLGSLCGAKPSSERHLALLRSRKWALPPEDQIGSGLERAIGEILGRLGVGQVEARDEFDAHVAVPVADFARDASVFHRIRHEVEPVVRLLPQGAPMLFAAAWDWPHVLVCARSLGLHRVLFGVDVEFVELDGNDLPRRWWHSRQSGSPRWRHGRARTSRST